MIELVVGGIYEGVGGKWTIISVDAEDTELPWVTAVIEGGGSVQLPLRDASKWFYTPVGMAEDKVLSLDEARDRLKSVLHQRDALNMQVAKLSMVVEPDR